MIYSMTGFGKAVAEIKNKKVTVEIKSLNSKQLDLNVKCAYQYREKEMEFRQMVQKALQRGKVDMSISVELNVADSAPRVNTELLKVYKAQFESALPELNLAQPGLDSESSALYLQLLMRMPNAILTETAEVEEDELNEVSKTVEKAISALIDFRKQEGESLYNVFTSKVNNIATLLKSVEPYEKERTEKIRQSILDKLSQLPADYDRNRFEQELIYYIEKLDINEEKHRLDNHLKYFVETMDGNEENGAGKKLGFIAQEMGREINTLGSKSNHAEMQRIVVKMKDELEQIKEQVLNVL